MNPYVIEVMLKEKRDAMLEEAERQRLIAQYEAGHPQKESKLAIVLADMLIRLGHKLKERYEPKPECRQGSF